MRPRSTLTPWLCDISGVSLSDHQEKVGYHDTITLPPNTALCMKSQIGILWRHIYFKIFSLINLSPVLFVISMLIWPQRVSTLVLTQWVPAWWGGGALFGQYSGAPTPGRGKITKNKYWTHQSNVGHWIFVCPFRSCIINSTLGQDFWLLSASSVMDCSKMWVWFGWSWL